MKRFFAMLLFLSITFLGGCTQTATKISENSDETIQPSVELSFSDDMLSHMMYRILIQQAAVHKLPDHLCGDAALYGDRRKPFCHPRCGAAGKTPVSG